MCGIAGIISNHNIEINHKQLLERSLAALHDRGPDNCDLICFKKAILGHTRLSIVDLDPRSNQPFWDCDKRYCITFNGEIYNFIEIRNMLLKKGAIFRTNSDTEVLVEAYKFWGPGFEKYLNGDWVFCIHDTERNAFYLSRDRYGAKPLYYSIYQNELSFASTIPALLALSNKKPELNLDQIASFILYGTTPSSTLKSWHKKVLVFPPSSYVLIDGSADLPQYLSHNYYWTYSATKSKLTYKQCIEKFHKLFLDSTKIRTRTDVGFGLALSGGIDSISSLAALDKLNTKTSKLQTYTVADSHSNSEETNFFYSSNIINDDACQAKNAANHFDTCHHEVSIKSSNDFFARLKKLVSALGYVHTSHSTVYLTCLYEKSQITQKVIFDGQGADEILCGYYPRLFWVEALDRVLRLDLFAAFKVLTAYRKAYSLSKSLIPVFNQVGFLPFKTLYNIVTGKHSLISKTYRSKSKLFLPNNVAYSSLGRFSLPLVRSVNIRSHQLDLSNLLSYGDAISMMYSQENRSVFLDHRLVSFCLSLPYQFHVNCGFTKSLLRASASRLGVPNSFIFQRYKFGFTTPLSFYLKQLEHEILAGIDFMETCPTIASLFQFDNLRQFVQTYMRSQHSDHATIYRILGVIAWSYTYAV